MVIYSRFHRNPFRGFGTPEGRKSGFPITLGSGFYNSLDYRPCCDKNFWTPLSVAVMLEWFSRHVYLELKLRQLYSHSQLSVVKGKVLPYSLPSVGSGADPGIQTVSPQVTISHPLAVGCHYFPTGLRFTFVSIYQMAPPLTEVTDIRLQLCYSSIDPERMKGWVDLVGWPIADGLPT